MVEASSSASSPLHVLTITPFYPSQQDEVDGCFVAEPIEHLADFNVKSTIIATKPSTQAPFTASAQAPEAICVRFPYVPFNSCWAAWGLSIYARVARMVTRLHGEHKFDLIHAHSSVPCGHPAAILARRLRIPLVVTSHGLDLFCRGLERDQPISQWWCERSARDVYLRADLNICVSDAVRRVMQNELGGAARATVIYNGVNPALFAPPNSDEVDERQTILSVGRLVPDKGQELVLRAFALLVQQYPTLHYELIDDGPERARLASLAAELKVAERVHFRGRVSRSEVAAAMKRCAIFALPSRDEALGCVYLEAMATARPVIACRGQGIEELIRQGENGWLIQADDLREMVQSLHALLANPALRARAGEQARKTVLEGLTLRHQAQRLSEAYRECLSERRGSQ